MHQSFKKTKVHIYPPFGSTNAYIKNMVDSFEASPKHEITRHRLRKKPLWNLYLNLDADICIFSWIEGMCSSWKGLMKFAHVIGFIIIMRLIGRDVVWILHNKHPHEKDSSLTRAAMRLLSKLSTCVITHSTEGVTYFKKQYHKDKCYYIPHPVYSTTLKPSGKTVWDYVVWGEINERKGVKEFLKYVREEPFFKNKRILICGRCKNKDLATSIEKLTSENVTFINRFIPDGEMDKLIGGSRYIVFTYHASSVLSSGALVYSLNYCKPIIGPNVGAFRDLAGIVATYQSFQDIPHLKVMGNQDMIEEYIKENQWESFPHKLDKILNEG